MPDMTLHTQDAPDKTPGDEFLNVDVDDPEGAAATERTHAHIVHCNTRCWSSVNSAESVFNLRAANNLYFEKHPADAEVNLLPLEYIALSHILGITLNVVEVQMYIEGDLYDTGSIVHPLSMMLRAHFAGGWVFCPQLQVRKFLGRGTTHL